MRIIKLTAILIILPCFANAAADDCHVSETTERYEVICTGEPVGSSSKVSKEEVVTPVKGKHRPQSSSMATEKSMRMKRIREQVQPSAAVSAQPGAALSRIE
jgi:hypothetical protein